jgi:hypothetical protein
MNARADLDAPKSRQMAAWASGGYAVIEAGAGSLVVPGDYLEVVITRR